MIARVVVIVGSTSPEPAGVEFIRSSSIRRGPLSLSPIASGGAICAPSFLSVSMTQVLLSKLLYIDTSS